MLVLLVELQQKQEDEASMLLGNIKHKVRSSNGILVTASLLLLYYTEHWSTRDCQPPITTSFIILNVLKMVVSVNSRQEKNLELRIQSSTGTPDASYS